MKVSIIREREFEAEVAFASGSLLLLCTELLVMPLNPSFLVGN